MKTGGILSRLTGDIDTTKGLLQMALVSPSVSLVRLVIALIVLFTLNWRLAMTALAIVAGVMVISFVCAPGPADLPLASQGRGTDRRAGGRNLDLVEHPAIPWSGTSASSSPAGR